MERVDHVKFELGELESFPNGKKYKVHLEIPSSVGFIDPAYFVVEDGPRTNRIPMKFIKNEDGIVVFEAETFLENRAVYRYFFEYSVQGKTYYVNRYDTKANLSYDEKNKLSVGFSVPDWAKGAVMYHIFVDRFYRGDPKPLERMKRRQIHKSWDEDVVLGDNPNVVKKYEGEQVWNVDFYGGDLKGIIKKLDYLKILGVDILYLSPIVRSQSNHRYDTADYENVDPYAGTNEDLRKLCQEAHKRGMYVVLDAVFNHTGDESKYFDRYGDYKTGNPSEDGVFQSRESKYQGLYKRTSSGDFSYWWGFPTLPETNCDGEFWRNYICGNGGVIDQWFQLGIDGLRLDVADNLSDWALEAIHDAVVRNKKDGFILGEVWDNPMRNGRSYISSGKSMHSVMNYPLVDGLIRYFKFHDPHKLGYVIRDTQAEYPKDTVDSLMNFTSTHDISRALTLLGKKEFDSFHLFKNLDNFQKTKVFEALWELGYSNDDIYGLFNGTKEIDYYDYQRMMGSLEKKLPPEVVGYLREILSFTPFDRHKTWVKDLPNDIEKNLPYTKKYKLTKEEYNKAKDVYQAYLLFLAAYPGIFSIFYGDEAGMEGLNNLANRRPYPWGKEDKELISYFQQLGEFRKKNPFLRDANFKLLELTPDVVKFERESEQGRAYVMINNSDSYREILVPSSYEGGEEVFTLKKTYKRLDPYGGIVIKK